MSNNYNIIETKFFTVIQPYTITAPSTSDQRNVVNNYTFNAGIFIKKISYYVILQDATGPKNYTYLRSEFQGYNASSLGISNTLPQSIVTTSTQYQELKNENLKISPRTNITITMTLYGSLAVNDAITYYITFEYFIVE